jgi:ComF family protein
MLPLVKNVLSDFVSLFYPSCCVACNDSLVKGESSLCTRCLLELPQTNYHLMPDNPLRNRLAGRIPVEYVFAFLKFAKNGKTQHLLHSLKYKGNAEIGVSLGRVFGQKLIDSGQSWTFDGVVPVPLHPSRLRRRGYNQSTKFADGISEVMGMPVFDEIVIRKTRTETQTRKTKLKRWENVSDVFELVENSNIDGKHLLIIDDVITTGATIEACANSLLRAASVSISVASIAVA